MANFVIKEEKTKRDPKHPGHDPNHAEWRRKGEQRWKTMQHTMPESEKKEYLAKVNNNPHNVVGMPALFPTIPLFSSLAGMRELTDEEKEIQRMEKLKELGIIDEELKCDTCEAVTVHSLSSSDCFCKKCGTHKPFRRIDPATIFTEEVLSLMPNKKELDN
jgi:hypothetical protein